MGLRINRTQSARVIPRASGAAVQASRQRPIDPSQGKVSSRAQVKPPTAGFGDGTISLPGAIVQTIKRGMQNARRVLPSAEEIAAAQQRRTHESRDAAGAQASLEAIPDSVRNAAPVAIGERETVESASAEGTVSSSSKLRNVGSKLPGSQHIDLHV